MNNCESVAHAVYAPRVAASLAHHIANFGKDVLIIIDDLMAVLEAHKTIENLGHPTNGFPQVSSVSQFIGSNCFWNLPNGTDASVTILSFIKEKRSPYVFIFKISILIYFVVTFIQNVYKS